MKQQIIWNPSDKEKELLDTAQKALEKFCELQDTCSNCPLYSSEDDNDCARSSLDESIDKMVIIP